ncbi:MAG: hypothetical protein KDE27_23570 [Planctomycetes bacterium]|nr:hypothetical protein [Planctomycetota bacterium]
MTEPRRTIRFELPDLVEQLEAFATRWPDAGFDERARGFAPVGEDGLLAPPLLALRPVPGENVRRYRRRCEDEGVAAGRHAVLLVRAAGVAIGYWHDAELLRHKAIRKYVIRGHGKAQATHLKTKGKSRYGARLRLQNWRSQLGETNEYLAAWWDELGAPRRVFVAVPVRVLSELLAADPPPPFGRDDPALERIPLHVHRPDHAELLRVHHRLGEGRVELPGN